MSYQRRVISGILTWRKRAQQRHADREGDGVGEQPAGQRPFDTARISEASAIHTTTAADAADQRAVPLRQHDIGQAQNDRRGIDRQARQRALGDEGGVVIEREKDVDGPPKSARSRPARRSPAPTAR